MAEIDHEFTKEIVCPYCGYVHSESYDFGGGGEEDSEAECGRCDRKFNWSRMISVSYSTSKIDGEEDEDGDDEDRDHYDEEEGHRDDCWCHDPDMGAQ